MSQQIHPEPNARKAGLVPFNLSTIDPKTGQISEWRAGVVMKSSAADKGVFINVCPWCESDLRWQAKPSAAAFAEARRHRRIPIGVEPRPEDLRAKKAVRRG